MRARRAPAGALRAGGQHGGVLLEAAIAIAMLLVLWGCAMLFYAAYWHKLVAQQAARRMAWDGSIAGCHGGLHDDLVDLATRLVQGVSAVDALVPMLMPDPGTTGQASRVAHAPTLIGADSYRVSVKTQFVCNEEAQSDGNLEAIAKWAANEFLPHL